MITCTYFYDAYGISYAYLVTSIVSTPLSYMTLVTLYLKKGSKVLSKVFCQSGWIWEKNNIYGTTGTGFIREVKRAFAK